MRKKNYTEEYKKRTKAYVKNMRAKSIMLTEILEGLHTKGWAKDVIEVCRPGREYDSQLVYLKSTAFDLLAATTEV
jgi:hypothetical protein